MQTPSKSWFSLFKLDELLTRLRSYIFLLFYVLLLFHTPFYVYITQSHLYITQSFSFVKLSYVNVTIFYLSMCIHVRCPHSCYTVLFALLRLCHNQNLTVFFLIAGKPRVDYQIPTAGTKGVQLEQTDGHLQWRHSSFRCPACSFSSLPQFFCVGVQTSPFQTHKWRKGKLHTYGL